MPILPVLLHRLLCSLGERVMFFAFHPELRDAGNGVASVNWCRSARPASRAARVFKPRFVLLWSKSKRQLERCISRNGSEKTGAEHVER